MIITFGLLAAIVCLYIFVYKPTRNSTKDEEYNIYINRLLNYQLSYPVNLTVDDRNPLVVIFKESDDYGDIVVTAEKTTFSDVGAWAERHISDVQRERYITKIAIDKELSIDGNKAVTFRQEYVKTYEAGNDGNMRVFFIKDGNLFTLDARNVIQEKIWDSFHFTK